MGVSAGCRARRGCGIRSSRGLTEQRKCSNEYGVQVRAVPKVGTSRIRGAMCWGGRCGSLGDHGFRQGAWRGSDGSSSSSRDSTRYGYNSTRWKASVGRCRGEDQARQCSRYELQSRESQTGEGRGEQAVTTMVLAGLLGPRGIRRGVWPGLPGSWFSSWFSGAG